MARTHRRTVTREDLLHRYANAAGITYGEAHDRAMNLSNDALRDRVEHVEAPDVPRGERAAFHRGSFVQSQPTTTVQGQTR